MADDIDDLLDECDDLLDKSRSSIKPKQKPSSKNISSSKKATRRDDKNLKRLAVSLQAFQSFPRYSEHFLPFPFMCIGMASIDFFSFSPSNVYIPFEVPR